MVHPIYDDDKSDNYALLCATENKGVVSIYEPPGSVIGTLNCDIKIKNDDHAATAIAISSVFAVGDAPVLVCGWENGDVSINPSRHVDMKMNVDKKGLHKQSRE